MFVKITSPVRIGSHAPGSGAGRGLLGTRAGGNDLSDHSGAAPVPAHAMWGGAACGGIGDTRF